MQGGGGVMGVFGRGDGMIYNDDGDWGLDLLPV